MSTSVTLNNGVEIPLVGLGVWKAKDGKETYDNVRWALDAGYRLIDTAFLYGNEASVGKAIKDSGIARSEVFVTTKLWNSDHGYENTMKAFQRSLDTLGMDYVDLYLIHWPGPNAESYLDTWRAFEKLYAEKKVRAIGLSNFDPDQVQMVLDHCKVKPMVDQVELHPLGQQLKLRDLCAREGIVVEACRPLGRGGMLALPAIEAIAAKHHRTTAQVIIRWMVQSQIVTIPKSSHEERVRSNFDVFNFNLDEEDMSAIAALNEEKLFGNDCKTFFPMEYSP